MKTLRQIANRLALAAHTNFDIPEAAELAFSSLKTDLPELRDKLTANVEIAPPSDSVRLLETVLFEAFSNAVLASEGDELDNLIKDDPIGDSDEEEESMVGDDTEDASLFEAVEKLVGTKVFKKTTKKKFLPID